MTDTFESVLAFSILTGDPFNSDDYFVYESRIRLSSIDLFEIDVNPLQRWYLMNMDMDM